MKKNEMTPHSMRPVTQSARGCHSRGSGSMWAATGAEADPTDAPSPIAEDDASIVYAAPGAGDRGAGAVGPSTP